MRTPPRPTVPRNRSDPTGPAATGWGEDGYGESRYGDRGQLVVTLDDGAKGLLSAIVTECDTRHKH